LTVLVTGIGYMGAALAGALLARGERVIGLDNRFSTDQRAIARLVEAGLEFVAGDIAEEADVEAAFARAPLAAVYHFAAQASAHPLAATVDYTERSNLRGPRVVLDAMLRHHVGTIVYASSFKVYGENLCGTIGEDQPYGAFRDMSHLSKVYAEKLLELYATVHGLRCLALRYGIVHGLGPVFKTDPRFMTAPNKFCQQAARGEPLSLFGGGQAPAGWVQLDDAVAATLAAAARPDFTGYTPLNVVGEVASVAQVAALVRDAGAARGLAVLIEGLAHDVPVTVSGFTVTSWLDTSPGGSALRGLRESIPAVLDHCLAAERAGAPR